MDRRVFLRTSGSALAVLSLPSWTGEWPLFSGAPLIPTTTSLKAAHGYSSVRAVLTWVIPIVLNLVVITGVVILVSRARL